MLIRKDGTEHEHRRQRRADPRPEQAKSSESFWSFATSRWSARTQDALLANEKLAVAGRLAATIAHEIHNPLDSVSNLLYLMRNGATEEESKQFMDMAEQELARVTQISRAMLGPLSRVEAPRSPSI